MIIRVPRIINVNTLENFARKYALDLLTEAHSFLTKLINLIKIITDNGSLLSI